jgi:hypothetical protein
MANFVHNEAKNQLMRGGLDFTSADMRLLLFMSNSTVMSQRDVNTISAVTTLDECDAAGYPAGGVALTGETVTEDAPGNRAFFDANDASFANLAAGTRQVAGMLLYKFQGGSVGASLPVAGFDTPGFPFWGNGSTVNIQWNVLGVIQVT